MKRLLTLKQLVSTLFLFVSLLISTCFFGQVSRQWVKFFDDRPNSWNQAKSIVTDDAGNAYVTGASTENNSWDIVTIKYSPTGSEEWAVRYDGFHGVDFPAGMTIDKSGNIYVTGYSEGNGTGNDIVTIKYNNAGVQQWVARYNSPDDSSEVAIGRHSVQVDNNGNVYVLGMSLAKNNQDFITIKYTSQGVQQWVQYFDGPGNGTDWPFDMALDPMTGDVYVTGYTTVIESVNVDMVLIKYNTSGVQQWIRRFNESYMDEAVAIDLDTQGNIYITGNNISNTNVSICVTVKYDASGTQKWAAHYSGPASLGSMPSALKVDGSGNVYVTGNTVSSPNISSCFTLKYNTNGIEQWVKVQNGFGTASTAESKALALDEVGNVFVTGFTDSSGVRVKRDYIIMKYNPEGVQEWLERYNKAYVSNDEPSDIAVNKFHDVFVTGTEARYTTPDYLTFHYLTIKYSQTNPLIVTASPDTTIYFGYASNCVQLKAEASGGVPPYTFTWSSSAYSSNGQIITVCPTATTKYTIIAKDAFGETDTMQVTIKVIDVRCGNQNDKVLVCHNGKEICIGYWAVATHLQHGDKLGSCSEVIKDCDKFNDLLYSKGKSPFIFKAYPNPFAFVTTIIYQLPLEAEVTITLLDFNGREISTIVHDKKRAGYYINFISAKKLIPGIYICRMVISSPPCQSIHILKLIIAK